MNPVGMNGAREAKSTLRQSWLRFVEFITNGMPPWDVGVLEAHWIAMGTTTYIREALLSARRRRRGLFALVSSWQRRYLDGMIWALDTELIRRNRSGEDGTGTRSSSRLGNPSALTEGRAIPDIDQSDCHHVGIVVEPTGPCWKP